jgi:hypothetical protein
MPEIPQTRMTDGGLALVALAVLCATGASSTVGARGQTALDVELAARVKAV